MSCKTRPDEDGGFGQMIALCVNARFLDVLISRGKSRFLDEVYIPNAGLRSSAELLEELQEAEGRGSCLKQWNSSIQEICSTHFSRTSNKDTCADTLSIPPSQASLFTQRTTLTQKRKWKIILANSSYGSALSIQVSKSVITIKKNENKMDHTIGSP